jgi:hypothetical protein
LDKGHTGKALNVIQHKAEYVESAGGAKPVEKLEYHVKYKPPVTHRHENQERQDGSGNDSRYAKERYYKPPGRQCQNEPTESKKKKRQFVCYKPCQRYAVIKITQVSNDDGKWENQ